MFASKNIAGFVYQISLKIALKGLIDKVTIGSGNNLAQITW